MKLCIAEKPSVAKEIAHILGAKSRKDGYFEGNGYAVSWTFGHLCTLNEPHDYFPEWKSWSLYRLPIIPQKFDIKIIPNKGVKKQFKILSGLIKQCDEIINCGDAGQEGELIQRWVMKKAGNKSPVKRLWISSLTEEAIKEGFANLQDEKDFDRLYMAGSSRAIGDWLLGINATRLYTVKYGQGKQVLSIGRVQTPTLALIVDRQLEIDNFKPAPYWELKTTYKEVLFSAKKGKFENREEAQAIVEKIQNKPFTISSFEKKPGKEYAPKLFDLTALQVECNKKFGFSADDTLKYVQSLYENKLVSYPRVDTTYLPNDQYPKIPQIMKGLAGYGKYTEPILSKEIRKSKRVFDDKKVTDHHAIIPTGVVARSLNQYLEKVYHTITRRFVANFMEDCEVSKTSVEGIVTDVEFKTSGKEILEPGWRAIYGKESQDPDNKEEDQILPSFIEGESGAHEISFQEKETKPPKFYTEASLLRAMETAGKNVDDDALREAMKENGIGRPSTRANIIETLFRRNYIRREKKKIVANQTGVELIQTIQNELLKSAELTGQWENKLRQIEQGNYNVVQFMNELKTMVNGIVVDVKSRPDKKITVVTKESLAAEKKAQKATNKKTSKASKEAACPKCKKGTLMKGKSAIGCSNYTNGCDFRLPFEAFGKKLTDKMLKEISTSGATKPIKELVVNQQKVDGILKLDANFALTFEQQEIKKAVVPCPKCEKGNIISGKTAFGCSNYLNGCDFRVQFTVYGKKVSQANIKALSKKRTTPLIKGFKHPQTGEKFNGYLFLEDETSKLKFRKEDS